ncbi:hypothetical protein CY34DRAFT_700247 [Suillus luteus UH-Slu-Lm8-n1]|uniref:Hyaluronan/mRNA-binding protein domain-containing protein n=1 Tax=Suillus luteus UH-Slu-Lm8-n1 TaxID=930992 RepID=A0A0D0B0M4_9AGAM|nr:hypothetical protein CY34DRAFT_700247 [Suillus luteus UH-Slu-Lm8-n1]
MDPGSCLRGHHNSLQSHPYRLIDPSKRAMSVATRNPFALLDGRLLLFNVILSLTFTYKQRTGHPLLPLHLSLLRQHPLHNHNQLVVVDAEALPLVVADTTSVGALHPLLVPLRLMTNQLQSQNQGDRKEGRGRGRGRGDRGRGRPFDKHSQTGKTDSDKKVHNSWGGDDGETERKTEEAATNDAFAENANATGGLNNWASPAAEAPSNDWAAPADAPPADDWAAPPAAEGAEKPQSGEKRERRGDREEEEDNTLTFDQYLAQQREKENALVPKLDVRKPNDGADDDVFKGAAPLQKDELEYFAAKAKSAPKARTKKDEKVFIEIEARFERPSRGGRGGRGGDRGGGERSRGERGRGRGGRGRGGANGHSAQGASAVNVDDETAFPSLS